MPPLDQAVIIDRIRKYLKKSNRDKDFFNKFKKGYCGGISTLWSYGKSLPKNEDSSHEDAIRLIAECMNKKDLDDEKKEKLR